MSASGSECQDVDRTKPTLTNAESTPDSSSVIADPERVKKRKTKIVKTMDKGRKIKGKMKGKVKFRTKGPGKKILQEFGNGLEESHEVSKSRRKTVGDQPDLELDLSRTGKKKIPRLKKALKDKKKGIKHRKQYKEDNSINEKIGRRQRKPFTLTRNGPPTLWSSDDENENKNTVRDNGSWDTFNMASSTGLAHRSDHSYDERDDLFFDSDDEREADIMENSDEDTEDASETDMATLEEEFTEMKEQMYQEKIKDLKQQLEQLKQGMHPEYLRKLKELEKQKEDWILMADAFREYELQEIQREFEKEKRQAKEEFELKKIDLKETLIIELTEKKKNIETERITLELTGDILEVKPVSTRKLRRRPNDPPPAPENKKRKTNATQLSLLLPEDSILADLKKLNKVAKNHISPTERVEKQVEVVQKERKAKIICGLFCPLVKYHPKSPVYQPKSDSDQEMDHGPPYEAKIEDGRLFYEKKWYTKGQAIYLETKDAVKIIAQIHSIGTNEIWIKKIQENTRLKLYLSHLHKGKYIIKKRSTSQNSRDS